MNKLFIFLFGVIFLTALTSAFCLDMIAPDVPTGLSITKNLVFSWNEAGDLPDPTPSCPSYGVAYYEIYLDGTKVGESESLSYTQAALVDGTYTLGVGAVDNVTEGSPNYGPVAEITVTFPLSSGGGNGGSGGGNGGSGGGSSGGGGSSDGESGDDDSESDGGDVSSQVDEGESRMDDIPSGETKKGFFSFITGAVINGTTTTGRIILILLIVILIVGYFLARKKRESASVNKVVKKTVKK
jgi:hypothetical protein